MTMTSSNTPAINVVIVAFNRPDSIVTLIKNLLNQTYPVHRIIVIDNSAENSVATALTKGFGSTMTYKRMSSNLGSAGGYREGIIEAEKDADFLWLFDDDMNIAPNALECLVRRIPELNRGGSLGALRCWYPGTTIVAPQPIREFAWRGTLISVSAVRKAGYPDADFFLYSDDVDYSMRIAKAGFVMYYVPDSQMFVNASPTRRTVTTLGFRVEYHASPFRLYYSVRNEIALAIRHRLFGRLIKVLLHSLKIIMAVTLFEKKNRPRFLTAIGTGVVHGFQGNLGKNQTFNL